MDKLTEEQIKKYREIVSKEDKPKNTFKKANPKIKEPKWCDECGYSVDLSGKCRNCEETKELEAKNADKRKSTLVKKLGGLMAYEKYTEEAFLNKKILNDCKDFPNSNLFIYGTVGTGKTHLGTALIRRCKNFYRLKPMQIFRAIRKANNATEEQDFINRLCETPLLIDDLGTEKLTEFAFQTIYEIIDGRYERKGKGLIITSNYGFNGLSIRFQNKNICSRLEQMCECVKLVGQDFRLKGAV